MTRDLRPARCRPPARSAPTRSPRRSSTRRASRALRSRSCAPVRAACSGSSRWSRSRRRRAASPTVRSQPRDVASLVDRPLRARPHPLCLGRPEEIPFLKRQTRITFARCGIVDPLSLDDYRAHGGWRGLERAQSLGAAKTSSKRSPSPACAAAAARASRPASSGRPSPTRPADQKYIVCNADEGDSGTYADRMIMEGDPFLLIEGMAIAGFAVGATKGYVYIRSEYPRRDRAAMRRAVELSAESIAALRDRGAGRRRRLCLRRGDLAARKRWKASAARCAPSRRCRRTRACSASRPSSTT